MAAKAAGLTGREVLQAIADGLLPPPPIAKLIGTELVFVGEGEVRFRCTPDESVYNPMGVLRADSGEIEVHGEVLRVGKRVAFAQAHARDATGELVGQATTSLAITRPA
jgi:acyl-coenzyme A thioesterase PaaI-like protein